MTSPHPRPGELWRFCAPDESFEAIVCVISKLDGTAGAYRCHCLSSSEEPYEPDDCWYFDDARMPGWYRLV